MLDPFSRGTILALSALCAAAVLALAPAGARTATPAPAPGAAFPGILRADAPVVVLAIERDPFDEPDNRRAPNLGTSPAEPAPKLEPLPDNLNTDVVPALPGTAPDAVVSSTHVSAVVTGAHPYALVESNGLHEIKGLGDRIGALTITAIDIDGIGFDRGPRLSVERSARP